MIATVAEKKKVQPWLSLRSLESGFHMIAAIAEFFFSAIAAITAIIWKPSLTVTNPWKDLQQARREAGRFTRRKGLHRSFLGYLGLSLQQLCTRSILSFFVEFFAANAWLRRAIQPNFPFYREHKQKKTNFTLSLSLPLDILVYEVFVFERVRLGLAELANWDNRSEVARNAKSLFKWRFRRRRLCAGIFSFFTIRWLVFAVNFGVRQGRGKYSFYSVPSACYHNREYSLT